MVERFDSTRRTVAVIASAVALTLAGCNAPADDESEPTASTTRGPRPATEMRSTPTRTGYADIDSLRIYYQIHGDLSSGETPLLALHGSFMSAEAMAPVVEPFAATRPVIAIDQRGHGRTGDAPGPITYERLADDAAGVLEALNVPVADVLGYSMGGTVAIGMAIRHPDRVGKQVILSGPSRREGWYPEVLEGMGQWTPEMFARTPLQAEYERLSPTPDAFPTLVEELREMEGRPYGWSEAEVRAIGHKTMVVIGDADGLELEHAVELFKLRGGGDTEAAANGFLPEPPQARLAILPATSHVGMLAQAQLIAELVTPFLEDAVPPTPEGFFGDTEARPSQ